MYVYSMNSMMYIHSLAFSTQDSGTPVTDLSAGSERSTLSRGGACFFDSSRGANDEGFHMEIDDSYDRLTYTIF